MIGLDLPSSTASEHDLVQIARDALSQCNWIVGKCAADWTERHARGRTDADFAELVGLSSDQVFQRRRVWETFGDVYESYAQLKWSHFYVALNWDDAPECLQWADENGATIAEMRAWRRALLGEDLSEPAEEFSSLADDPNIARLVASPSDVRAPEEFESGERSGRERSHEEGDDIPFVPSTVSSAHRDVEGSDYAPFRKDAGSAAGEQPAEFPEDEKPAGQIAKRVISTLERMVNLLGPQIVARFKTLPEKDRARLVGAVRALAERITVLDPQPQSTR